MSLARAALLSLLAVGCGARTGLDFETPPFDAAVRPRFDAGTFTTFPCRWTLGEPASIARGGPFAELTGAVHPTRDEAVVVALDASTTTRVGARVSIAASGGVLEPLADAPPGGLFTTASGYAVHPLDRCGLDERDARFAPTGDRFDWDPSVCRLTQSVVERLEAVSAVGQVYEVTGLGGGMVDARVVATTAATAGEVFAFHEATERTTLIARQDGRTVALERHLASRAVERFEVSTDAAGLTAAADPLRGGMIVHYRDATDGWRLEHFDWEAGRWPEAHFDLRGLPEPAGPIATNETEILMPLADGRIAYVPFALVTLMVRWIDPVEGGAVDRMQVILRPNGSAGGVLYENRGALWFQPLVCNR